MWGIGKEQNMKMAGIHKRCKMYGLSVLLMLMMLLGSGISVNAASSGITKQTVRTAVASSGTQAIRIQWNKVSGANGYIREVMK